MSGSEELSREELIALVEQQVRLFVEQTERIEALQTEVTELKRWLGTTRATVCSRRRPVDRRAAACARSTARLVLLMPRQSGRVDSLTGGCCGAVGVHAGGLAGGADAQHGDDGARADSRLSGSRTSPLVAARCGCWGCAEHCGIGQT